MKSRIPNLLRNRRGVSPVISNIILVAAVIVVGFAVLAWTYSTSSSYTTQYSSAVNSDIDKLRERVAFEYIFYNNTTTPKSLSVYIMNFGQVGKVNVTTAYVSNSSWLAPPFSNIQLKFLNTTSTSYLNAGQEGYFVLSLSSITLQTGSSYTVKIVTWRGSIFESTFVA
jgi:flagellin-like protein